MRVRGRGRGRGRVRVRVSTLQLGEARSLTLTQALSEVGVADAVVQLLSAARDVAARSPYQVRAREGRVRASPNPNHEV